MSPVPSISPSVQKEVYHGPAIGHPELILPHDGPELAPWRPSLPIEYTYNQPLDLRASQRTICGLVQSNFWLIFALIFVTIAWAASLGTVVGLHAAERRHSNHTCSVGATSSTRGQFASSPSPTTTSMPLASSTPTLSYPLPTTGLIRYNCPSQNGTTYNSQLFNQLFRYEVICDAVYPSSTNGYYVDVISMTTYTLEACIDACSSLNSRSGAIRCAAVAWGANLTDFMSGPHGNCFLKNSTITYKQNRNMFRVGAVLLDKGRPAL